MFLVASNIVVESYFLSHILLGLHLESILLQRKGDVVKKKHIFTPSSLTII